MYSNMDRENRRKQLCQEGGRKKHIECVLLTKAEDFTVSDRKVREKWRGKGWGGISQPPTLPHQAILGKGPRGDPGALKSHIITTMKEEGRKRAEVILLFPATRAGAEPWISQSRLPSPLPLINPCPSVLLPCKLIPRDALPANQGRVRDTTHHKNVPTTQKNFRRWHNVTTAGKVWIQNGQVWNWFKKAGIWVPWWWLRCS